MVQAVLRTVQAVCGCRAASAEHGKYYLRISDPEVIFTQNLGITKITYCRMAANVV